jgi:hypothetical protein
MNGSHHMLPKRRFIARQRSPAVLPFALPFLCLTAGGMSPELRPLLPLSMSMATCVAGADLMQC